VQQAGFRARRPWRFFRSPARSTRASLNINCNNALDVDLATHQESEQAALTASMILAHRMHSGALRLAVAHSAAATRC
jgi:hypothetical protein